MANRFQFEDIEVNINIDGDEGEDKDTSSVGIDLKDQENTVEDIVDYLRKADEVIEDNLHLLEHFKLFKVTKQTLHLVNTENRFGRGINMNLPYYTESEEIIDVDGGGVGGLDKDKDIDVINIDNDVVLEGIGENLKNAKMRIKSAFQKLSTAAGDLFNTIISTVNLVNKRFKVLKSSVIDNIGNVPKDAFNGKKAFSCTFKDFNVLVNAFTAAVTKDRILNISNDSQLIRYGELFKDKSKAEKEMTKIFSKMMAALELNGTAVSLDLKEQKYDKTNILYVPVIKSTKSSKSITKANIDLGEGGWTPAGVKSLAPKVENLINILLTQKAKTKEFQAAANTLATVDDRSGDIQTILAITVAKVVTRETISLYSRTCKQAVVLCQMFCNIVTRLK